MAKPPIIKHLRFEFFRPELPSSSLTFSEILKKASDVTNFPGRLKLKSGNPIRWEFLEKLDDDLWVGDITRIRDDVVPNKAARSRARERLKVAADEGTTEDTVFAYVPALDVLICHNNRFGASAYDIVTYFAEMAGVSGFVDVSVVLDQPEEGDLQQFNSYGKLTFKVALPRKGAMPRAGDVSVDTAIDAANEVGARFCEMVLSAGNAKKKMNAAAITSIVKGLLRMHAQSESKRSVRKLTLTGLTEDGESTELDFLKERLQDHQEVTVTKDRDLPYPERRTAIQKAYAAQKTALENWFAGEE